MSFRFERSVHCIDGDEYTTQAMEELAEEQEAITSGESTAG